MSNIIRLTRISQTDLQNVFRKDILIIVSWSSLVILGNILLVSLNDSHDLEQRSMNALTVFWLFALWQQSTYQYGKARVYINYDCIIKC